MARRGASAALVWVGLLGCALAAGCVSGGGGEKSLESMTPAGWSVQAAAGVSPPVMTAIAPSEESHPELVVYIEGDGRAWYRNRVPPSDPTPREATGLKLALATPPGHSVAYLARPCQFLPTTSTECSPSLWTIERYGEATVSALDEALDQLKEDPTQHVVLVGYSGGGVMAALLAARRHDVAGLITVAANLDIEAWTTIHNVTPLMGSYNPVEFADALARVPQLHFSGTEDDVVPVQVAYGYLSQLGLSPEDHLESLDGFDHGCCWEAEWPTLFHRAMMRLE